MEAEQPLYLSNKLLDSERSRGWSQLIVTALAVIALGVAWSTPAEAQCAHDICEVGESLSANCDPCVADICQGDPYCCDNQGEWDDFCVEKVLTVCEDPSCKAACSHNLCEVGDPLDSTCNFCAALICFQDPSCCTDTWDATCVFKVEQECGYQCEPGENVCANALPIGSGRVFGTLLGASNDGCETTQSSCRSADVWYSYTQVVEQDMVLSTCSTERSFGIDTVLSVHEGCPGLKVNEIVANDDYLLGLVPTACANEAAPNFLDAALPLGGVFALDPGETVVIRVAHHNESTRGNFELRILPEPGIWLSLVAGAGVLGALSRRRARR